MLLWIVRILVVLLAYSVYRLRLREKARVKDIFANKNVLLLTAHPDDEAMFFAPFIIRAQKYGAKVSLLCLTNGANGGEGDIREGELRRAAASLNLTSVEVVDDLSLPDSMEVEWDQLQLAEKVQEHMKDVKADILVTFDEYGISGHINHRALGTLKSDLPTYRLRTVNVFHKYSGVLSFLIDLLMDRGDFIFILDNEIIKAYRAMSHHRSQLLWFRYLYLALSRYMFINTLYQDIQDK